MNKFLIKRRLIIFGLSIMGVVSSYGQAVGDEFTVKDDPNKLIYHITSYSGTANGDNQVSIVGTGDCPEQTTIPASVTDDKNNTYKVVAVFRFADAKNVKELTISEGVTKIQASAFGRLKSLTTISLPSTLAEIEEGVFAYCPNLKTITVAEGNQHFSVDGKCALYDKNKTTLYFYPISTDDKEYEVASTVTSILPFAVSCDQQEAKDYSLEKVVLSSGLKTISPVAFVGFQTLKEYYIEGSNADFSTPSGLLCNKGEDELIAFPMAGGTSADVTSDKGRNVKLPSTIKKIGERAFFVNINVNSIDLNQVVTLGKEAFYRCPYLTTVDVPTTTTSISSDAFAEAGKLQCINVKQGNTVYKSVDGVLYSADGTTLLTYPVSNFDFTQKSKYEIPEGTTTISASAFTGSNKNLTEVVIPNSVATMGEKAFASSGIKKVTLGTGLTTIPDYAFWLSGLEELEIPANITSIGASAFYNCSDLAKVTIADNSQLKTIGNSAFANLSKMTDFTFAGSCSLEFIDQFAFGNAILQQFDLPASVTKLGVKAFAGCANLAAFNFADNAQITQIQANAFQDCSGLESITIPSSVTLIAGQAFNNCSKLTKVQIPSTTTSIDPTAFYFCEKLTNIEVDKNNANYASIDGMLCSKDKKTLLIFPAGKANDKITLLSPSFETIGKQAFYYCKKLTNVTLPKKLSKIEAEAFRMCDNLKTIAFLSDQPIISDNIGKDAFLPQQGTDILENITNFFVRSENIDNYKISDVWSKYASKMKTSFTTSDGLEYFPMSDEAVNLLKATTDAYTLVVPASVVNTNDNNHQYTVNMIGDYAFEKDSEHPDANANLKEVVVEGDIIYIGSWAFNTNVRPTSNGASVVAATNTGDSQIENIFFTSANMKGTELSTKRFELGTDYAEFTGNQHIYVRKSVKENAEDTWGDYKERLEYKIPLPEINTTYSTFSREFDVDMSDENWNDDEAKPNVIAFTSGYFHAVTEKTDEDKPVTNYMVHMESINNHELPEENGSGNGTFIPKNTGVLLKATTADGKSPEGFYYQIYDKETAIPTAPDDNLMKAVTVKPATLEYAQGQEFYNFIMSQGKLYRLLKSGYEMAVHKSYLQLTKTDWEKAHPTVTTSAKVSFVFDGGNTTGIQVVNQENKDVDGAFYTLDGMKVSQPSKGIYIHNGKKYVVK